MQVGCNYLRIHRILTKFAVGLACLYQKGVRTVSTGPRPHRTCSTDTTNISESGYQVHLRDRRSRLLARKAHYL